MKLILKYKPNPSFRARYVKPLCQSLSQTLMAAKLLLEIFKPHRRAVPNSGIFPDCSGQVSQLHRVKGHPVLLHRSLQRLQQLVLVQPAVAWMRKLWTFRILMNCFETYTQTHTHTHTLSLSSPSLSLSLSHTQLGVIFKLQYRMK